MVEEKISLVRLLTGQVTTGNVLYVAIGRILLTIHARLLHIQIKMKLKAGLCLVVWMECVMVLVIIF